MRKNRHSRIIALILAAATLLAGCGSDLPSEDAESIPVITSVTETSSHSSEEITTAQTRPTSSTGEAATTAASETTQPASSETEEAVTTNAPSAGDQPYSPTIDNPPDSGGYAPLPSESQSYTPPTTTKKTTSPPATTNRNTVSPPSTTTKAPSPPKRKATAQELLSDMTLHEKVCQMFMAAPEGLTGYGSFNYADAHTYSCYDKYPIGGYIFFANNLSSSDQTRKMLSDLQSYAKSKGAGVFLATDEEGGRITRVSYKLGAPAVYDMSYYGSLGSYSEARNVGTTIGTYLADYGFNVDLAPVADVNLNPNNELGNRIFSSDPKIVSSMSAAVVEGLKGAGVCSTLKHFPGLGAGSSNTHYGSVTIDRTYEQMKQTEFVAFKGGIDAGCEFVMLGHQIVTGAGDNMPADLSKVIVTDWLRGDLGFDGITITDSQAMGAIADVYGCSEAAVLSVEAGIDVILMPARLSEAVSGVENAVSTGRISEKRINESVLRILEQKERLGLLS